MFALEGAGRTAGSVNCKIISSSSSQFQGVAYLRNRTKRKFHVLGCVIEKEFPGFWLTWYVRTGWFDAIISYEQLSQMLE
jgi:hypothetical protein